MTQPRVALFVTCLVDLFRPTVAFAAIKLLQDAGCQVEVPLQQSCCGQPAYNSGDRKNAVALAKQTIEAFEGFDFIVAPSGSCTGMMAHHYPALFDAADPWKKRAEAFAAKTHELVSFLTDVMKVKNVQASFAGSVTYHDSCSGLRELKIKEQPRQLLAGVAGLTLSEMDESHVCCGFGGTFCVKYPDISNKMLDEKVKRIAASGAKTLLAGDLGCLLNMAGKLAREESALEVRHIAEVLAGMTDRPAIGREKT